MIPGTSLSYPGLGLPQAVPTLMRGGSTSAGAPVEELAVPNQSRNSPEGCHGAQGQTEEGSHP